MYRQQQNPKDNGVLTSKCYPKKKNYSQSRILYLTKLTFKNKRLPFVAMLE